MRTKLQAGLDYLKEHFFEASIWKQETLDAFNSGIEFAQRMIPLEEATPDLGVSVMLFNKAWIDEDCNPDGIRIGFRQDNGFISAHWWNYQDCYMTISEEECRHNPTFSKEIQTTTEPTHWRPYKII